MTWVLVLWLLPGVRSNTVIVSLSFKTKVLCMEAGAELHKRKSEIGFACDAQGDL